MGFVDWFKSGGFGGKAAPPVEQRAAPTTPYPVFLPSIGNNTPLYSPSATESMRAAYGNGYASNSAVYACISALQRTYAEAPIRAYQELPSGQREALEEHPTVTLLETPNSAMTGANLLAYVQYCKAVYGNAYVRKVRAGNPVTGEVVELWPLSPALCWPVRERGAEEFISYYRYQFGEAANQVEKIPVADIIHFRNGLDDRDHKLGLSPLRQLLREVDTDVQTTAMSDRLVRRNGVPGMVVSVPAEAGDPGPEAAQRIKQSIDLAFTGEGQGSTAVMFGGATAAAYGFNPQQLDLTSLHRLPEERIAAVLGVPAIIAGLGAGLDRATYANFKEAREMFVESTIIPAYVEDADTLTRQLLREFDDRPQVVLAFDITNMRALQDDENAKYTRLSLGLNKQPWITINEARTDVGLDTLGPEYDVIITTPAPVTPDPTDQQPPTPLKSLSTKLLSPVDFERAMRVLRAAQEEPLANAIQALLDGQRQRVVSRYQESA